MFDKAKHNKEYWGKNKERLYAERRKKYAENAEYRKRAAKQRIEWRKNNPDKYQAALERARGKRLRKRFLILQRDNFTCQYCGRKAPDVVLHVDHIKPKAKGGTNSLENYKTACFDCNIGKGDYFLN